LGDLRERTWRVGYSSDEDDLITAFYEPAMAAAIKYDRAVGYFSSRALALIAGGIQSLYLRNGKMRLIASPALSVEDREAIRRGVTERETLIEQRLLEYLDPARLTADEGARLCLLSGMIADGLLEVRVAVKREEDGDLNLYHEKIGVFADAQGDFVTFIGSPNESWNGWVGNAESFAVHTSWGQTQLHAAHERELFERTWSGRRPRVPVFDFPAAVREKLFDNFPPRPPDPSRPRPGSKVGRRPLELPAWLRGGAALRDYQKQAINRWLEANGRGVFAMATGTGKTVTALVAAVQVIKAARRASMLIVVSVPTKDLVEQWARSAREFGFEPICCHSDTSARWPDDLDAVVQRHRFGGQATDMVLTTADTLSTPRFSDVLATHDGPMMLIADEMHSMGTNRRLAALPNAKYRLGLSATPQRHGDEDGTRDLLAYFGPIHQQIGIKEAIALKALVPYTYTPVLVPLAADEMERYRELSAQIAALLGASGDGEDMMDRAGYLLVQRARLLGHAAAKLPALEQLMRPLAGSRHNLVYVAEGRHPLRETRQLEQVLELLGTKLAMAVNAYTSETPSERRAELQGMLRNGTLQALLAMRCLDEGIDIPEVRRGVILASTQNPRQFVQRRGRILRRDDFGGKTSAELYDMLVVPDRPPPRDHPTFRTERRLVGRELSRALELASASMNGADSPPEALVAAMERYDLLELVANYTQPKSWADGGPSVYD
jgi:superfamily II DNA or RNA helicase